MKKTLLLLVILVIPFAAQAQSGKIAGSWLMIKAEKKGKVQEPYFITEFKSDGTMQVMGIKAGHWKIDEKGSTLIMESKLDKDFNGRAKIAKLTADDMVLSKDGAVFTYKRVNPANIAKANAQSGLAGEWTLSGTDYPSAFLKFSLPDSFALVQASAGEVDQSKGNWIFEPNGPAIIFMGFSHLLRGKVPLANLTSGAFALNLSDRTLHARRLTADEMKIERLNFKEEDFPEEQPDLSAQLPWQDFDKMVAVLQKVKELQYSFGKLVEGFQTLRYSSSILAKIKVDARKPRVEFTYLMISEGDTSQFSQKIKGRLQESFNPFFPKDEPNSYRIVGVEKVTAPAGTFACTVVEGMDGFKKVKYWMSNDLPGVYVKTIVEGTDPFGHLDYTLTVLDKIIRR